MIQVLFAAQPDKWAEYAPHLETGFKEARLAVSLSQDLAPSTVDYIIYAPNSELQDFTPFTACKAVLNLWAGVETIVGNETLTQPLCRMVDPAMTQGMVEWVSGHVLRHHLGMDAHIKAPAATWQPSAPPVAWDRKITVLGLGQLGAACATSLARLGFNVHGYARTMKEIDGVTCHTDIKAALDAADGVVLLLPNTPQTQNTLNAERLSYVAPGAFVLNPGRGPLIEDAALLDALRRGQIGHATLDTFRVEPLPPDDPYWHHPNVTVTPHIASETRPKWASKVIVENIARSEAGLPLLHVVDRDRGY